MKAKVDEFKRSLEGKTREDLIQTAVALFEEKEIVMLRLKTFEDAEPDLIRQFQDAKKELELVKKELNELRKENIRNAEIRIEREKALFGRSTEKIEDIVSDIGQSIPDSDPLDEDENCDNVNEASTSEKRKLFEDKKTTRRSKQTGKRDRDLDSLPMQEVYNYDVDELDQQFPEGWRIAFWRETRQIIHVRSYNYLEVTYTPVLSVGLEHRMASMPSPPAIIPKSLASPSLLAAIFCDKYRLFLPYYRQEHDPERFGIPVSRQDMSNWEIHVCEELLIKPYLHQGELLKTRPHQQCDETVWLVINDGRKPGSKSFLWTHRTSEMEDHETIIHVCYELTRGSGHLENFFAGIQEPIHLTSDAYAAYYTLRDMMEGLIVLCGCLMHARKRYVEAVDVMKIPSDMPLEQRLEMPEVKALLLIAKIYHAEQPLRGLSSDERKTRRKTEVRPRVDDFFDYIKGIDISAPDISEKMRDAINYSINHEKELREFLNDGNVPIDDIATERAIRPIAQLRNNALFSCTPRGARASVIIISLIETARANGVDPYYYLCYLLTVLPLHIGEKNEEYMDDMMPWSEAYRTYEKSEKQRLVHLLSPPDSGKKPVCRSGPKHLSAAS